jgi:hypothetical protein
MAIFTTFASLGCAHRSYQKDGYLEGFFQAQTHRENVESRAEIQDDRAISINLSFFFGQLDHRDTLPVILVLECPLN